MDKIGIGMYTVHQSVKKNMYGTFQQLSAMGYQAIECYGELEYDTTLLKKSRQDANLTLSGWHVEWKNLQKECFARTVDYLQKVDCPFAVIPCLGGKWEVNHGPKEECSDIWFRYIDEINEICEKLKKEGIRTAYHNHEHEFLLQYNGKTVFDLLFEGLSKEVVIELDSGNCIEAGADPIRVIEQYQDRDIILHLKPYSFSNGFHTVLGDKEDANPWENILDAGKKKFLWMLIESENERLDEMKNAELCLQAFQKIMNGR